MTSCSSYLHPIRNTVWDCTHFTSLWTTLFQIWSFMIPHLLSRSIPFRDTVNLLIRPMKIWEVMILTLKRKILSSNKINNFFGWRHMCSKNHPQWPLFIMTSYHESTEPATAQCHEDELTQRMQSTNTSIQIVLYWNIISACTWHTDSTCWHRNWKLPLGIIYQSLEG